MDNEMTINILVGGPREELPENFGKAVLVKIIG